MVNAFRRIGLLMMLAGVVVITVYLLAEVAPPVRWLWVWFATLPGPIQVGLAVAALGFFILSASLLWERWLDREDDRKLRES